MIKTKLCSNFPNYSDIFEVEMSLCGDLKSRKVAPGKINDFSITFLSQRLFVSDYILTLRINVKCLVEYDKILNSVC